MRRVSDAAENLLSVLFWPIVFIALWFFFKGKNDAHAAFIKAGGIERVTVGNYLVGLPKVTRRVLSMKCEVYENEFVFCDGRRQLDSIPRDAINQIIVDTKSQITQRITATRMLTLGVFALAAPKRETNQEFCLLIDWDNAKGLKQNTIFDFVSTGANAMANNAANKLNHYAKHKVTRLQPTERKCPSCAEIVKREATRCRHCQSELPPEELSWQQ